MDFNLSLKKNQNYIGHQGPESQGFLDMCPFLFIFTYMMDILDMAENLVIPSNGPYSSLLLSISLTAYGWEVKTGCDSGAFRHHKYSFPAQEGLNSTPAAFLRFPSVCISWEVWNLLCLLRTVWILHPFPSTSGLQRSLRSQATPEQAGNKPPTA